MSSNNNNPPQKPPVTINNPYAAAKKKNPSPSRPPPRPSSSAAAAPPIRNPYAPLMSTNAAGRATTTATSRTAPNNNLNNNNNSNNFQNFNNSDGGLLSQVQPMSFTQAFGGDDDYDHVGDQHQQRQQQQHQQGNSSSSIGPNGGSTDNDPNSNRSNGQQQQQQQQHDKRVGHNLIAKHVLGVSTRQKGNPVLHHIRNVPFDYFDMTPDYIMSATSCALFLSLKYHRLYPDYIHRRLSELRTDFKLRVLLVLVDVSDNADLILQLNRLGVVNNMTVVLAWSEAEAGRYLETYKALDGKDASSIQKRESNHIVDQMQDFWTACKPVNKTDAASLWEHFGNLKTVTKASRDEWALVSGLGPVKIQRLYEALHKPFSSRATRKRKREREEKAAAEAEAAEAARLKDQQEDEQEEYQLEDEVEAIDTAGEK